MSIVSGTIRTALGLTSIAVGATEILAPQALQNLMGLKPKYTGVLRILGIREVLHGVDLLSHDDPAPGIHARVAGDLLDGAMLAAAATQTTKPAGFAAVAALVTPIVVADTLLALSPPRG